MSRAAAALALLAALVVSSLATVGPVAASAAPVRSDGQGVVEPSAKADPTGRYLVVYRKDADTKAANARAKGRGVKADRTYKHALHGYAARLSATQLAATKADPAVAFVQPDGIIRAQGQTIPRGIRRVDTVRNVTSRIDGTDQRVDADVAIFDTGIDRSHPDLNVVGGYNCSSPNTAAWGDGNGHGTHVAGTVGALDNGQGVVGVAPGVRLWAVRILGSDGSGLVSWYVCGMDWIAGQRDPQDPTRPLIEATNMSVAKSGSDDRNCGLTNKDAMHAAICRLVAAGVTVVAAAGNNSFSASRLIPASYNEVITVSALADTDGQPGGLGGNSCYSWGSYDTDDTFANFSNYGSDVDIIAPGKCIWSTLPGNRYGYSSGTSMAAPHVTGAVALWLSTRPGRTPAEAKAGVLAATTLDWKTSTDPDGNPDRLLDVSRIVPAGDFTVAAGRSWSWVSGAGATRTVSVRGIRAEDFTGDIALAADVPAPLSATFGTATLAAGESPLTSVAITVPAKTASGTYTVTVRASNGGRTRTVPIRLRVDSAGPVALVPTIRPRLGSIFNTTSYTADASWGAATDNANGVAGYQARWRVDGGTWSAPVSLDAASRTLARTMGTSHKYELRVRASDGLGNWGAWVTSPVFATGIAQDTSPSLVLAGAWKRSTLAHWSKGSALTTRASGATISRTFFGRAVAWVGATGPTRGKARVWIDDVAVATIDLRAPSVTYRKLVYVRWWATPATHTIRIEALGTTDRPRVDLDALIFMR